MADVKRLIIVMLGVSKCENDLSKPIQ